MKADLLIVNSSELLTLETKRGFKIGAELNELGIIKNGAVAVNNGLIIDVGRTSVLLKKFKTAKRILDAGGKTVMPGFVDPHTHLIFAGSRAFEYEAKILGQSQETSHRAGKQKGGIFYTTAMTRRATRNELSKKALGDLGTILRSGVTTLEAKSGYGLDVKNEIKILKVIEELNKRQPIEIAATFLGAHVVPEEYINRRQEYIVLLKKLLKRIKIEGLAEFCDVFCDKLGFSVKESEEILKAAKALGYKIKLHVEQTGHTGGVKLADQYGAVSCDHLDYADKKDIGFLSQNRIAAVLLPTVTFHLMESKIFWPALARKMIENGVIVALASDYNPGSAPCPSIKTALECAARLYRMRLAEIISAATINAAYALGRQNSVGSLEKGKKADILILDCCDWRELINAMGTNLVNHVIKNGKMVL